MEDIIIVYIVENLKKDKVTVDHFFPINKVKNSSYSSINIRPLKNLESKILMIKETSYVPARVVTRQKDQKVEFGL